MDEISERSFLDDGQIINFVQNAINTEQYCMYGTVASFIITLYACLND